MRHLLLLAALVLTSSSAFAQEDCDRNDESQQMMNVCADQDYREADAKLNTTYRDLSKAMEDDAHGRKLLQTAQRAWIAFRDAECAFSAADSEGGSIYPMLVSGCLQHVTEARTEQLKSYSDCEEGDVTCVQPDGSEQ